VPACVVALVPLVSQEVNGVRRVRVQAGLMSKELSTALTAASKHKVLHFTSMANALQNFSDARDWLRFSDRMKQYGSIWCCVLAHPGHIHYDLLFDMPHRDKFMRLWDANKTWVPTTGP
jgi:hypothetical protein